jgi:hypothetical protein
MSEGTSRTIFEMMTIIYKMFRLVKLGIDAVQAGNSLYLNSDLHKVCEGAD